MPGLWNLGGLRWKQLLKRVGEQIVNDDVFGQAAKLSFFFLLALFPFMLFLTTLFGYFAQSADLRSGLLNYFQRVVPRSAFQLVVDTLDQITSGAGRGKLSIGIVFTLWAASSGMLAMTEGLNTAYGLEDERPWWKQRVIATLLTIAFAVFTVAALLMIVTGEGIGKFFVDQVGYRSEFVTLWKIGRVPVALLIVLLVISLLYRFAPDLKGWNRRWLTPGALVAVALWVLVSFGFRLYLRFFSFSYNATYGSLGAVIILLLWLYLTGVAVLIGAEVNSAIETAAARSGEPDARVRGERRPDINRLRRLARIRGTRRAERQRASLPVAGEGSEPGRKAKEA